jgi:serine/threonine protein kinase/Tfp pilus assembly protein PilF
MVDHMSEDDKTQSFSVLGGGLLVNHYRIVERLGAGGMGEVFLAEDTKLGRKVALKFLPRHLCSDEMFKERFLREARSAAALSHPNIITIHEVSEFENQLFIAMEYVKGRTLREIANEKTVDVQGVISLIIQVSQGLLAAHELGIVHRDIKPENILVNERGQAKILDFGLAVETEGSNLTRTGTALGTANYMSPEQAQAGDVDQRSDIFSLGAVLYELLAGKAPFQRDNLPATLHAIVYQDAEPITQFSSDLPSGLDAVVRKSLAKSLEERYQSVADFADQLLMISSEMPNASFVRPSHIRPPAPSTPATPHVKSLAVLLLRNLGDKGDDFLSYGISEDLIVDLTRIGSLRVVPLRSVLKYRDSDEDLEEIAAKLKVRYLLDGSIHKSDTTVRVSAMLVDISTGDNLWADRWEESVDSVANVKSALADSISKALKVESAAVKAVIVSEEKAPDPQAYEYYLRGKYAFGQKRTSADVEVALGLYRKALSDEPGLIEARAGVAEILIHKGEYQSAEEELSAAIKEASARGRKADEAHLLMLFAQSQVGQGYWDRVWEYGTKALKISKAIGDLAGEAEELGLLIHVLTLRAKFDQTLELFERVLEINRKLDDQEKAAVALKNMGTVHVRMGEYQKARELYEEARNMARRQNDKSLEADCIGNTGLTYFHTGDYAKALGSYQEALTIHEQLGNRSRTALWHNNIAMVHESSGRYRQALESFGHVAALEQDGDRARFALALGNAAAMHALLYEFDEAMEKSEKALSLAAELDYPLLKASVQDTLAQVAFAADRKEDAENRYELAIRISEGANLKLNHAVTLSNLGEMHYLSGDREKAAEELKESLKIGQQINQIDAILKASAYLAALEADKVGLPETEKKLDSLLAEARRHGDPRLVVVVERVMAGIMLRKGEAGEATKKAESLLLEARALAEEKELMLEISLIDDMIHGRKL